MDESQFFLSDNFDIDEKLKTKFLVKENTEIFNNLISLLDDENN